MKFATVVFVASVLTAFSACSSLDYNLGSGSGAVTGSAGPNGSQNAPAQLQHSSRPIGTVAVVEEDLEGDLIPGQGNYGYYVQYARRYNLPQSVVPLVRLMAQQSNCFRIVDRHSGMRSSIREIGLAEQGYLRKGSNISRGQLKEADFNLIPTLSFSEENAGALGAVVGAITGSLFGGRAAAGSVLGGVRFKEAQVTLSLVNNRTGEQLAISEGSASKADLGAGFGGYYGNAAGAAGGWGNSNEAKIVSAAFLDAMTKIVSELPSSTVRVSQR